MACKGSGAEEMGIKMHKVAHLAETDADFIAVMGAAIVGVHRMMRHLKHFRISNRLPSLEEIS